MRRELRSERCARLVLIDQHDHGRVRTSTGIEIGGAHIRPPPAPSEDAEKLQAALLRSIARQHGKPGARGNGRIRSWLLAATIGAAVAGVMFYGNELRGMLPW